MHHDHDLRLRGRCWCRGRGRMGCVAHDPDERGISIEMRAPDEAVLARAQPGAVDQVLDNLLDNALNASPDHGVVRVELNPGSDEHVLAISDQGPGLSDADKDRAIRRFWRGDASTSGTGLGLAIASALVSGSRGSLELTDSADEGLRVVVRLAAATRQGSVTSQLTPGDHQSR